MSVREEASTASHEAGHVVVARVLTVPCDRVSIVKDYEDGSAGHAIIPAPNSVMDEWDKAGKYHRELSSAFRGCILARMAGLEAQLEFGFPDEGTDSDDRSEIGLMLDCLLPVGRSDETWERCERRLRSMTRMLVRRHRSSIEAIANALLLQKRLVGQQTIDDIIEISRASDPN